MRKHIWHAGLIGLLPLLVNATPSPTICQLPTNITSCFTLLHLNYDVNTQPDSSGSGNTGTLVKSTYTASGKFVGCYVWDGDLTSYIYFADPGKPASGMTALLWFKPSAVNPGAVPLLVRNKVGGPDDISWHIYQSNNAIYAYLTVAVTSDAGSVPTAGLWYFVACTTDMVTDRIYVNGLEVKTGGSVAYLNGATANGVLIGSRNGGAGTGYVGSIDEVCVVQRYMTAGEIYHLYFNNPKSRQE